MALKTNFVFLIVIILLFLFVSNMNVYNIVPRENGVCDCEKMEYCFFSNIINLDKLTKPKIFVHIENENSVLGICELCVESLMKYCSRDYDIVLYTNNDVSRLVGEEDDELCNIKNIELLGGQDLAQWEEYCKFKILQKHGGVVMKPHFLFSTCPDYKEFAPSRLKICRVNNEGASVSNQLVIPSSCYMIAAPKNDATTKVYVEYLRKLCQHNYSSDTKHFNKTFEQLHILDYFSEESIGVLDSNKDLVYLENILTNRPIKFSSKNYCLFINIDLLRKKRHQGWALSMSKEQLLETKTVIGYYAKI